MTPRPPRPAAAAATSLATVRGQTVRLAEVLSALTYALDLTEGQRPGHTLRTAVIAMRLGRELDLSDDVMSALYYAALLKDSGCSSNAARMAALFGSDDQAVKGSMRLVDWHDKFRLAMRTAKNCGIGSSPLARLRHFLLIANTPQMTQEIISARCERGAQIAHGLGFPDSTSETIAHVDEHWCGLGHPSGMSGTEIPLLSRIVLLAQTFEAYNSEQGLDAAFAMIRARRGRWFDPRLTDLLAGWRNDSAWWSGIADIRHTEEEVVSLEPGESPLLASDERLDTIAYAFASVIDAKTPFTYRHSTNVAAFAAVLARALGHDQAAARDLLRAGLLHDIGKLGISNRILDKPGRLTPEERAEILRHPVWTWEILERVPAFHRFAWPAALHHERLDGEGYPWGIGADELTFEARILGIADMYEAMTADRPYRKGMHASEAIALLMKDRGAALDADMLDAAEHLALSGTFQRVADGQEEPFTITA